MNSNIFHMFIGHLHMNALYHAELFSADGLEIEKWSGVWKINFFLCLNCPMKVKAEVSWNSLFPLYSESRSTLQYTEKNGSHRDIHKL